LWHCLFVGMIGVPDPSLSSPLAPEPSDGLPSTVLPLYQTQQILPETTTTTTTSSSQSVFSEPHLHRRIPSDPPPSLFPKSMNPSQVGRSFFPEYNPPDSLSSTTEHIRLPLGQAPFLTSSGERSSPKPPSAYSPPMTFQQLSGSGSAPYQPLPKPFPQSHSVSTGLGQLVQFGSFSSSTSQLPQEGLSHGLGGSSHFGHAPSLYQPQQLSDIGGGGSSASSAGAAGGGLDGTTSSFQFGLQRPLTLTTTNPFGETSDLLSDQMSLLSISGNPPLQSQQQGVTSPSLRQRSESPEQGLYMLPPHYLPTSRSMVHISQPRAANVVIHQNPKLHNHLTLIFLVFYGFLQDNILFFTFP